MSQTLWAHSTTRTTPYVYKKKSTTLDDAHDITDILWQAIEIDGLDSVECHADVEIEANGEYEDSDELYFTAKVVRTDTPSQYVAWGNKNRISSRLTGRKVHSAYERHKPKALLETTNTFAYNKQARTVPRAGSYFL